MQHKIAKVEEVPAASSVYELADNLSQTQTVNKADGVNRPDTNPFAISGSVVNLNI